ncbi:MAG: hypothetical protein EP330_10455 [Deltaproteobacteria bacterium]|nr:MAG: hypothetical protein EP330_10455 [Deltaproteobacteria bacterium]
MAIAKKGKRRLVVDDRDYLWWAAPDWENVHSPGVVTAQIASTDGHFLVQYALGQSAERAHVVVLGREFAGEDRPGPWRRYRSPVFVEGEAIAPSAMRALVLWCREVAEREPVDSRGEALA